MTEPTAKCVGRIAKHAVTPTLVMFAKTVISKTTTVMNAFLVLQIVNTAVQRQCALSAILISMSRTMFALDAKMRVGSSKASIV